MVPRVISAQRTVLTEEDLDELSKTVQDVDGTKQADRHEGHSGVEALTRGGSSP